MAEFLIRRCNHSLKDVANKTSFTTAQLKIVETCQELGDVIEVYEDGRCKEAPIASSPHYIIKVNGLKKADWDYLNRPLTHTVTEKVDGREVQREVMDKRRRYQIDLANLPAEIKSAVEKEYQVEMKEEDFKKFIIDKAELAEKA